MENIYGQDLLERNSIVAIPDGYATNAGNTLYSWLGSLWRSIHRGDDMVRGLQQARGIRLAQLYLDILEAAKLQDRNGLPVFHRELWHPIVLRLSQRNKAQENMLNIGEEGADIGPQPSGSVYGEDTVLEMGKLANYENYVTYPLGNNIAGVSASIVDNILNPTVSMEYGKNDFLFRNNSIIFPKENDPLAPGSAFDKVDLPDFVDGKPDVEVVLWASDVLINKNYLAEHLSYPLGADAPSSDIVKRILNAAWSSLASGLTPELLRTFIAAMLNIPVIQNERETVISIDVSDDEQLVSTDAGVYRVSPRAKLIDSLHSGMVLRRGDLLDESLRVYPFLNNIRSADGSGGSSSSPDGQSAVDTGFSVPLEQDIPSVVLPSDILRVRTKYGIYAMWGLSEVKQYDSDPNHLYFDLGGTEEDVEAFWHDIWDRAESDGKEMKDLIGEKGDKISPAGFFLKNFIGANTLFVVIDRSQLDDISLLRDPMFFGMLNSVVPSAIRLFFVEHRSVDEDEANLDSLSQEATFLAAALPEVDEHVEEAGLPGLVGRGASVGDRVMMRFIRPAPVKVRVRKEED